MTYDTDYFIRKFEAIPDSQWCTGLYTNMVRQHCALGHCGAAVGDLPPEAWALRLLFSKYYDIPVTYVNDGKGWHIPLSGPRSRVLRALRRIKKKENRACTG